MTLREKEKRLRGEYPKIWAAIKFGSLTSIEAADLRISLNLPRRCSDLERMLGVTIRREPVKLPSGKRVKRYSWRPSK